MALPPPNPPQGYTTLEGLAELFGIGKSGLKKILVGAENQYNKKYREFLKPLLTIKPRSGSQVYNYYKIPTDNQLAKIKEFFGRTTISQDLVNDIKALHNSKVVQSSLNKGTIPSLEVLMDVTGKSVGRTANALGTLGKMYRGDSYRGFELPKNAKKGKLIFNKIKSGRSMTNPLKRAWYNIAVDEVDKSIGKEVGTFRKFKRFFKENLNRRLGTGHGFSLNEITSINAAVNNKLSPYAAFVDITKSDINTGQLAGLQGDLSKALTRADKLIKAGNVDLGYEEIRKFNEITRPKFIKGIEAKFPGASDQIRFPEIKTGTKLTDTYKASDLARYKEMGIDLQKLADEKKYYLDVKGARPYPEIEKNLKRNLLDAANRLSKKDQVMYCSLLSRGGLPGDCAAAIDNNPVKAAQVFDEAPVTSKGMEKVKNAASSFLNFAKRGGKYGAIAAAGAATAGLVKTFMNDDPTTYLSNEDQQKNMLISMVTDPIDDTPQEDPAILDYQLPTLGAVTAAGMVPGGKRLYDVRRRGGPNLKPAGPVRSALGLRGVLGKGLAATATPLGLAALEPLHIAGQIAQGDSPTDIATNPWNYLGPTFAAPLTKEATKFAGPTMSKIMRMGMSPTALRGLSRFGGYGLAASLGIQGLQKFDDWRNKRGWFSEE
jgi:hypothetical protein